jgi:hypothetical protein
MDPELLPIDAPHRADGASDPAQLVPAMAGRAKCFPGDGSMDPVSGRGMAVRH